MVLTIHGPGLALPPAAPPAAATSQAAADDDSKSEWEFSSSSSEGPTPEAAPLLPVQRAWGPPPHLLRSDVLRAPSFAPREAPQAFQGLLNNLATFRIADVAAEFRSARVGDGGTVYIWLRLLFGGAPAHADANAGDTKSEFYVQVTLSPTGLSQPGQPDAWDAALS